MSQERPAGYQYFDILKAHLGGDLSKIFNGELIYPRQLEIHLPGNHKRPCNFNCYYCQGRILQQPVDDYWELKALKLVNELEARIPFFIFGGAYSEPLLNPYLLTFLATVKDHGNHYGIHTNGSLLRLLEQEQGFLTELCRIATDGQDYLSFSLDAGRPESHMRTKGLKRDYFTDIIKGLEMAVSIRGNREGPAIRVCYLLNTANSSEWEIKGIIKIMRRLGVDSLRFSIPYDLYGKAFAQVEKYRDSVECARGPEYEKRLRALASKSKRERPYIFYVPPTYQDVKRMDYKQCIYSYYQITIGADGYVYRCSSTATPSFSMNRLGKIPDDLLTFNVMVLANHNPKWDPQTCFRVGARCNRMALELNSRWQELSNED